MGCCIYTHKFNIRLYDVSIYVKYPINYEKQRRCKEISVAPLCDILKEIKDELWNIGVAISHQSRFIPLSFLIPCILILYNSKPIALDANASRLKRLNGSLEREGDVSSYLSIYRYRPLHFLQKWTRPNFKMNARHLLKKIIIIKLKNLRFLPLQRANKICLVGLSLLITFSISMKPRKVEMSRLRFAACSSKN